MFVDAGPPRQMSFLRNTSACSGRPNCRLLAPLVIGLVLQTSTGCTLVGYAIGGAVTPAARSVPAQNVREIPIGTDVEVFYSPRPSEHAPAADAPLVQVSCAPPTADASMATGAYRGIEAGKLVLDNEVLGGPTPDLYSSGGSPRFETRRVTVPLGYVNCIRTKSSLTPRLVGMLVGAALDVVAVVAYAHAVRDIQ